MGRPDVPWETGQKRTGLSLSEGASGEPREQSPRSSLEADTRVSAAGRAGAP